MNKPPSVRTDDGGGCVRQGTGVIGLVGSHQETFWTGPPGAKEVHSMPTPLRERLQRIGRFVQHHADQETYRFDDVPDPRDPRGVRWSVGGQLRAVWLALLMGASTIREVESTSEELGTARRRNGRLDRLPDSTLEYLLPDLEVAAFRAKLRGQVYQMQRAKALDPVGLPLGVLAVDGKTLGSYDNDLGGAGQKNTREDGSPYWLLRVLRAVLVTALTKPCIDQGLIAAQTNDRALSPPSSRR